MGERLSALEAAKAELPRRAEARPRALSQDERSRLLALGADLATVWHVATTMQRDRKEPLRALLEEVIVKIERDKATARLTRRWKGGALAEIDLALPRSRPATIAPMRIRSLVRWLAGAAHMTCDRDIVRFICRDKGGGRIPLH
jgi:hypothetical protein